MINSFVICCWPSICQTITTDDIRCYLWTYCITSIKLCRLTLGFSVLHVRIWPVISSQLHTSCLKVHI